MNRELRVPARLLADRDDITPCPALPGAVIHAAQIEGV